MQIHHILSGGASDGNEMTIGDYMSGKLMVGANCAGFLKVATAMMAQGITY